MLEFSATLLFNFLIASSKLHLYSQIEAIMNDFIQLKPESNVYEAETMIEGNLILANFFVNVFIHSFAEKKRDGAVGFNWP